MRRYQIRKLREAGLDPYMRVTWHEAQAQLQAAQKSLQEISALNVSGKIIAAPIITKTEASPTEIIPAPAQQIPAVISAHASDRTCPHCGRVLSRVIHLKRHLNTCPERLKLLEATA
jgi:hypothetical protein